MNLAVCLVAVLLFQENQVLTSAVLDVALLKYKLIALVWIRHQGLGFLHSSQVMWNLKALMSLYRLK